MALDSTGTDQSHKAHRSRQAGPKKKTKSDKKKKKNISENDKKQNPKVPLASFLIVHHF
jgi:ribosome biogenesis protein BMS1